MRVRKHGRRSQKDQVVAQVAGVCHAIVWRAPEKEMIKKNVDAASRNGVAAVGIIARNEKSEALWFWRSPVAPDLAQETKLISVHTTVILDK